MKKNPFYLMIILLFAVSLFYPTRPVAAKGANRVDFSAISTVDCSIDPSWCSFGELRTLPNGKAFLYGWKQIVVFTATDPRWNVNCYYAGDPFPPGGGAFPIPGSFTCYPRETKYTGGWWVGNIQQAFQVDKVLGVWHVKGYGTFDNLETTTYQTNPHWFGDVLPGTTDVGTIIELPGYQE